MVKSSDHLPLQKTITQNTKKPTSEKKITILIFVHFFPRGGSHFFPLGKTFFSNILKYTCCRFHFCLYMEDTKCESTYHTKVWYTPHNPHANQKRHSRLWLKHVLVTGSKTMSWKMMVNIRSIPVRRSSDSLATMPDNSCFASICNCADISITIRVKNRTENFI